MKSRRAISSFHLYPWAPPFERFFNQSTLGSSFPLILLNKAPVGVAMTPGKRSLGRKTKDLTLELACVSSLCDHREGPGSGARTARGSRPAPQPTQDGHLQQGSQEACRVCLGHGGRTCLPRPSETLEAYSGTHRGPGGKDLPPHPFPTGFLKNCGETHRTSHSPLSRVRFSAISPFLMTGSHPPHLLPEHVDPPRGVPPHSPSAAPSNRPCTLGLERSSRRSDQRITHHDTL